MSPSDYNIMPICIRSYFATKSSRFAAWIRYRRRPLPMTDKCCSFCCNSANTKRCSCKQVWYCSTACQNLHWKIHKKSCSVTASRSSSWAESKALHDEAGCIAKLAQQNMELELSQNFLRGRMVSFWQAPSMSKFLLWGEGAEEESCQIEVLTVAREGEEHFVNRPRVNCGIITGRFCDGGERLPDVWALLAGKAYNPGEPCLASVRIPTEEWLKNQRTPLCIHCESLLRVCRFCRMVPACTPPAHTSDNIAKATAVYFTSIAIRRTTQKTAKKAMRRR